MTTQKVTDLIHEDHLSTPSTTTQFDALQKLDRDLRASAKTMSEQEARYLVDTYYQLQRDRIRTSNRVFALYKSADESAEPVEPHALIGWLHRNSTTLEKNIGLGLDVYSANHPVGEWSRLQVGIGPVLAAGLLAHIDITKANYPSNIFSFAGLAPGVEWKKGQKRPWNATLKTLCWKIGESFCKVSGNPNAVYGGVYKARRILETRLNEEGKYADQAAAILDKFNIGKDTDAYKAYKQGKLPKGHIWQRSKRYATKIFLSHWHTVAYFHHYGKEPARPWIIEHGKHEDYVPPPNFDPKVFPIREGVSRSP